MGQLESCESWEVCPRAPGGDCNDLQVRGTGSTAGFHFILQCVGVELANPREAELTGKNSHPLSSGGSFLHRVAICKSKDITNKHKLQTI